MTLLSDVSHEVKKFLYSIFIISMLFLFRKMILHRHKSYGLLMVFILAVPLFTTAIIRLLTLFIKSSPLSMDTIRVLSKFTSFWTICLAIFHYSVLKSFKDKFWQFPVKSFLLYTSLLCLIISFLTSLE